LNKKTQIYFENNWNDENLYESWKSIEPWEPFDNFHIQNFLKEKHNKFVVYWDLGKLSYSHGSWQT